MSEPLWQPYSFRCSYLLVCLSPLSLSQHKSHRAAELRPISFAEFHNSELLRELEPTPDHGCAHARLEEESEKSRGSPASDVLLPNPQIWRGCETAHHYNLRFVSNSNPSTRTQAMPFVGSQTSRTRSVSLNDSSTALMASYPLICRA